MHINSETISIEQIKANPNLDLSERMNLYGDGFNFGEEQLKDLCIAGINADYTFLIKNRTVKNERTDQLIQQVLNGHILDKVEMFEMFCDDENKISNMRKFEDIKNNIEKNNCITYDNFDFLCKEMELDDKMSELMKTEFEKKGLIIDEYKDIESFQI